MSSWVRRILVVDDDSMATTLLGALLVHEGYEVQTCADVTTARSLVTTFDPDLAILDVHLGGGPSGLQLGYALARLHPEIALLYLTRYPTALLTDPAMREHVGGQAVLAKDDIHDEGVLLNAIESACRGSAVGSVGEVSSDPQLRKLTSIQLDILAFVTEGMTNAGIAEMRKTSERAVEKQLKKIYRILGLSERGDQNPRVLAAMKYVQAMGASELDQAPQ
jgi:DNA-binding NarL/FixJ family response regulator